LYNSESGIVQAFGFDNKIWNTLKTGYGPHLKRFAVQFTRKPRITVGYGKDVPHDGKFTRNESVEENLELAYAVSIHKAQGSEFSHTFVIIPASTKRPVSAELVYTALTRANRHCTLLLERNVTGLLDARRRENAQTPQINSSLFELHVAKAALRDRRGWYEALSGDMLRSKSEVIIANLLHERDIPSATNGHCSQETGLSGCRTSRLSGAARRSSGSTSAAWTSATMPMNARESARGTSTGSQGSY
jgi:exodeoxyribonuclease V alpha subunit